MDTENQYSHPNPNCPKEGGPSTKARLPERTLAIDRSKPPRVSSGTRPASTSGQGPKVFLSYRRSDTSNFAMRLAQRLRSDLGGDQVFRDQSDLIGGEDWRQRLASEIEAADAFMMIVGKDWTGGEGKAARIASADDPVRSEVRQALQQGDSVSCVPIIVDTPSPPTDLPEDIKQAFDTPHQVRARSHEMLSRKDVAYQKILAAVWLSKVRKMDGVVLVVGGNAQVDVKAFAKKLNSDERVKDASRLSQIAAGAYVVRPKRMRSLARRWPGVIVVVDDNADDRETKARVAALWATPGFGPVAVVGTGATALLAGIQLGERGSPATGPHSSSNSTITPFTTTSSFVSSTPRAGAIAAAGGALAMAAIGITALVSGLMAWPWSTGSESAFPERSVLSATTEVRSPFGTNDDVTVALRPVGDDGDQRQVSVTFDDTGQTVEVGELDFSDVAARAEQLGEGELTLDPIYREDAVASGPSFQVNAFCHDSDDASSVTAGYSFIDEDLAIAVVPSATVEEGEIVTTTLLVLVAGRTELVKTDVGLEDGHDFERCLNFDLEASWELTQAS